MSRSLTQSFALCGLLVLCSSGCRGGSAPGSATDGTGGTTVDVSPDAGETIGGASVAPSGADTPGATCVGQAQDDAPSPLGQLLVIGPLTRQPVAPPAIAGGTLAVLSDDQTAVAADPDRDQVYVVDLAARKVTATIALEVGDEPGRVIQDSSGRVHVALRRGGAIVTIDPVLGAVVRRREVCAAPRGLAYDPATDLLHVACAGGELISLPASEGEPVRRLVLDRDLRDVVVDGDVLWVSRFRSAEVLTVDANGNVIQRISPPAFRSDQTRGGQLFSPAVAWRMVAVPGDGVAMIHQRGVDDEVQHGTSGSYGGKDSCQAIVHGAVTRVKRDGTVTDGLALAEFPLPVDLAVSPDGSTVAIASAANDPATSKRLGQFGVHVSDMDTISTEGRKRGCRSRSGTNCAPSAFGGDASKCRSAVPTPTGQAIAVAFGMAGQVIVQSREPAMLEVPGGSPIALSLLGRVDTGHKLFHANAGAGLACASCHAEGNDDGRVWNFACVGRRRTQSLQTGIRGTEPFHWDGDEKDFPQLVRDVFTKRMGGPTLAADQSDAILSWIDSQPRAKANAASDTTAAERGRAIFSDASKAACASCHQGPGLTNNKTVDVGTGGAFQVPSLVGIGTHAPFMHNGCARTLRDRFSAACGGGDRHGLTSTLKDDELSDLISYLETL